MADVETGIKSVCWRKENGHLCLLFFAECFINAILVGQVSQLRLFVLHIAGFKLLLPVNLSLHFIESTHMFCHGVSCYRVPGYGISRLHGSLCSMYS